MCLSVSNHFLCFVLVKDLVITNILSMTHREDLSCLDISGRLKLKPVVVIPEQCANRSNVLSSRAEVTSVDVMGNKLTCQYSRNVTLCM